MAAEIVDQDQSNSYCVVLTTCASKEDARELCTALLNKRLAACIQVVDIDSYYIWQGEEMNEQEKLLLIKTKSTLYSDVEATLRSVHKYDVPEIVRLPLVAGSSAYLSWIDEVTKVK